MSAAIGVLTKCGCVGSWMHSRLCHCSAKASRSWLWTIDSACTCLQPDLRMPSLLSVRGEGRGRRSDAWPSELG